MEKVKIVECKPIMNDRAHSVKLVDGRQCTAWNDKVDAGILMQAYASHAEIEMEIKPYTSKAGKTGLNIVAVKSAETTMTSEHPAVQTGQVEQTTMNSGHPTTMQEYINEGQPQRDYVNNDKSKSIVAQCLTKVVYGAEGGRQDAVLNTYQFFLKEL